MTTALLHFVITMGVCSAAAPPLIRARWTWRSPLLGIVTWQLLALAWSLCLVSTLLVLGVAPYRESMPTAVVDAIVNVAAVREPKGLTVIHWGPLLAGVATAVALLGAAAASWIAPARTRRRHRALLALVARHDPDLPGVLLVDHPIVTAYCVPGVRARVVVSSGALRILTRQELAAVLAHERAHARERHDLAILPFCALRRLFPRCATLGEAFNAVALLLEMRADDVACRRQSTPSLAAALRRFHRLGSVTARLDRIARPRPALPATARWAVLGAAVVLAATPISFFILP